MSLELPGATAQSAVKQILLGPELFESRADVALEIIPLQTELFTGHLECCLDFLTSVLYQIFLPAGLPVSRCLGVGGLKYFHRQLLD